MNVLILGSEGAIGSHMVKVLPSYLTDCNIIRVSRTNILASRDSVSHTILVGDLLDIDFVKSVFENYAINLIIFCAAKWNGINQDPTVIDVNVTMFNNVLSSLNKSVCNFIFLSSSAVYSQDSFNDSEVLEFLPKSTYGQSKLISELLLLNKAKQNNMSYRDALRNSATKSAYVKGGNIFNPVDAFKSGYKFGYKTLGPALLGKK